jgi:hypothetical protein
MFDTFPEANLPHCPVLLRSNLVEGLTADKKVVKQIPLAARYLNDGYRALTEIAYQWLVCWYQMEFHNSDHHGSYSTKAFIAKAAVIDMEQIKPGSEKRDNWRPKSGGRMDLVIQQFLKDHPWRLGLNAKERKRAAKITFECPQCHDAITSENAEFNWRLLVGFRFTCPECTEPWIEVIRYCD